MKIKVVLSRKDRKRLEKFKKAVTGKTEHMSNVVNNGRARIAALIAPGE